MAVTIPTQQTWLNDLSSAQIKLVQASLNDFVHKTGLKGFAALRIDGQSGKHTRDRIRLAKYFLGYVGERDARVSRRFLRRLEHPNWLILSTPVRVRRGIKRRRAHNVVWKREHSNLPGHVGSFDGIAVAAYFIPILEWCRRNGWHGHLVSGYRTPAYSEHLCIVMCGHPTCPGRCAGRYTNHAGLDYRKTPTGAVDVSDYVTFRSVVARCPLTPRIFNNLPIDPVHFSPHGN